MISSDSPVPGLAELEYDVADYLESRGLDLLARWERHRGFWDARLACGLDSSLRTVLENGGSEAEVLTRGREVVTGINLAAQDPLAIANHPTIHAAAAEAIGRWGVHAAGSLPWGGGSPPLALLEERIAEVLCCCEATVFPTGWSAGYGVLRALIRPTDHVVIDEAAGAGLREGAAAATSNLYRMPHCTPTAVTACLARIRARDAQGGILVVVPALSPLDSVVADIVGLRDQCRAQGALLLVDIAHDFGAIGDSGLGFLGTQAMIGEVDVVVGSLAKTFVTNGGFVASASPGIRQALAVFAPTLTHSHALSPLQAAIALAAFGIVCSAEGARRRGRLVENVLRLRTGLVARAFTIFGQPSCIVPIVFANNAEARLMTREALLGGALVNLLEHPAVPKATPQWRLLPTANHSAEQIDRFIRIVVAAREKVADWLRSPMET